MGHVGPPGGSTSTRPPRRDQSGRPPLPPPTAGRVRSGVAWSPLRLHPGAETLAAGLRLGPSQRRLESRSAARPSVHLQSGTQLLGCPVNAGLGAACAEAE